MQRMPSFVPLTPLAGILKIHDKETGITQCRLSNGIRINYKVNLVPGVIVVIFPQSHGFLKNVAFVYMFYYF